LQVCVKLAKPVNWKFRPCDRRPGVALEKSFGSRLTAENAEIFASLILLNNVFNNN